ncbi:MAG: DUF1828 domain-containing protein [Culicoidibacterales bacterium]
MNKEFTKLYTNWLLENTLEDEVSPGIFKITLPFVENCHNSLVVIYVIDQGDNKLLLTDDGDTVHELEMSGLNFTDKRTEHLHSLISSHGVTLDEDNAISITTTRERFANAKHALLQTIMKVYDMYTMKKEYVQSFFNEDIKNVLVEQEIFFSENAIVIGSDSINYQYDFTIPTKTGITYFIKTINSPTKEKVLAALYCCEKSKEAKHNDVFTIVFNDKHDKFTDSLETIINSNNSVPTISSTEFANNVHSWQQMH